ncbi:MAG: primosomal protein N', partial [Bacillota bacterium]
LVNIIIESKNNNKVINASNKLARFFDEYLESIEEILGPSPAPIERIRQKYRWQLILKFNKYDKRKNVLEDLRKKFFPYNEQSVKFNIDVDPISML